MSLDNPAIDTKYLHRSAVSSPTVGSIADIVNVIEMGPAGISRAVTDVLYVCPTGDNSNGSSVAKAYTTIPGALAVASTNINACTLIWVCVNTGPNNYDINTTGDPTFTGNYIIAGTHRTWAKIKNEHETATSILKFTGYVSLINLNFNLGTSNNGIIFAKGAFRANRCQFVGEDLTSAKTALLLDGTGALKHGKVDDCHFLGEGTTHMTGIKLDNVVRSKFKDIRIHDCKTAIQIVDAGSDVNEFDCIDIGDSGIGFDIDAGNEQHLCDVKFHHCTTNIDDEVGDHLMCNIFGHFPTILLPDNFTGVDLDTGAGTAWGNDTEILPAAGRDKPFRVVEVSVEADANEKFRIRLSSDSGATHFVDFQVEGETAAARRQSISLPSGTEEIFNHATRISGSAKSESGSNTATVWIGIQEI